MRTSNAHPKRVGVYSDCAETFLMLYVKTEIFIKKKKNLISVNDRLAAASLSDTSPCWELPAAFKAAGNMGITLRQAL